MNATGVEWDNGRQGKNRTWTHEIRWPAGNPKNIVRVTSKRSSGDSHKKAKAVIRCMNLTFLSGWVPVMSADHADDGHVEALAIHKEYIALSRKEDN